MTDTTMSFRFFYHVTQIRRTGVSSELAFENWRRVGGNQFVALQNKFRVNSVACRLAYPVAAEGTIELVFVIVVAPEIEAFTIWSKFLLFVQHHQLRCAPRLTRPPHVTPEFVIGFEVTPPNEIISGRLCRDVLYHFYSCLLNSLRHGFATAEEHRAQ